MALYKNAIDTDKSKNGVWKEFKGAEFLIASMSATTLIKMRNDYLEEDGEDLKINNDKLAESIIKNGILKDWKGILDFETDEELEFSDEAAKELLVEYEDLCTLIISVAQEETNFFRKKDLEKVEKVKKPSTGK